MSRHNVCFFCRAFVVIFDYHTALFMTSNPESVGETTGLNKRNYFLGFAFYFGTGKFVFTGVCF